MAKSFGDQLRQAIRDSGWTGYALAKETGILQSQISLFMRDLGGLQQSNIEKVFALLQLRIVVPGGKAGKPKVKSTRVKK
jgi:hypothetical protein